MSQQQHIEAVQTAVNTLHHIDTEQNAEQYLAFVYSTVNQFCDKYPAFTRGGVRAVIFNERENGLAESGAIVRLGRKILINEFKWFSWVEKQNQGAK
jgi:hypothetical protein